GGQLVRLQGLGVMRRMREQQARCEPPALPMREGLALLIAGFCLILPGLITDMIGFLGVNPPLRSWAAGSLRARAVTVQSGGVYVRGGTTGNRHTRKRDSSVIEGDYERRDD